MKLQYLFLISCLSISSHFYAQSVDDRNVFFIGHSLVNFDMPEMFDEIANSLNKNNAYDLQVGIGAPLIWNYDHPEEAQGASAFDELPTGNYNTLVMTEAVPLLNHLDWNDTYTYATNFHNLGAAVNNNMQTYIYETWHCIHSGTPEGCDWDDNGHIPWRNRLTQDLPLWEGIADAIDNRSPHGAPPALIVPAGQGLAAVYDNITNGTLPGLTDIEDLFGDYIHMNDLGNYFIALVQYATIYQESPVGATADIQGPWGHSYNIPYENTALITRLQEIAWEVVSTYPRSGVNSGVNPPFPPSVTADCKLRIGTNLSGVTDFATELPFVNLMRNAREWYTTNADDFNAPFNSEMAAHLSYREDGYPTHAPQNILESEFPQVVKTIWGYTSGWPIGEYTVLYDGTGTLEFWGGHSNLTQVNSNKMTFDFLQPEGNLLEMIITQSDINDPIRNIRVLIPDTESTYQSQPFNPLFIQHLQTFKTVRFMNWGRVNNWATAQPWEWDDPHLYDWEERAKLDYYTWATTKGVPYEVMIKLMNDYDLNGWLCIPHQASDNYIQNMAQLFKDELEPERKIYVEYSNEIWNWIFGQANWLFKYASGEDESNWPEGVVPYIQNCLDIWSNVFADDLDRLVRVAGVHTGWQDVSNRIVTNLEAGSFDAISPAFYFGFSDEAEANLDALGANATVADIDYWARASMQQGQNFIRSQKNNLADVLGVPMVFYEGGQHLTPNPFGVEPSYAQALLDIQRDDRMYDLYQDWFDFLRTLQEGDEPIDLMHYSFINARSAQYGSWGMLETLDQDTDVIPAPKYQAILDNQNTGCDETILSVEMLDFKAQSKDCSIDLIWKINTGIKHDYFEVERSLDNQHFESIATLEESDFYKHQNKYHFVDQEVTEGQYYYRLKQLSLDGAYDYSPVKTVNTNCLGALPFHIFPNPTEGMVNISLNQSLPDNTLIVITNTLGQVVHHLPVQESLNLEGMASGIYFVQILSQGQKSQAQRLIVRN